MSNLFSTFDPQSFLSMPLCWLSIFLILFFLPSNFWKMNSPAQSTFYKMKFTLNQEFSTIYGSQSAPALTFLTLSLCFFLVVNNFLGLMPYVFTASSHLSFTMALAVPLWLGHNMMGWLKTSNNMLAHLVPLSTPIVLMPFMVLIELTSNLIRPLTLSVRLAANMMAGHLLLTLLTQSAPSQTYAMMVVLTSSVIVLMMLESAVTLIQAYVFSVLSTLYLNEVNSSQM